MFTTHKAENSVEYITSNIIRSRHAFATRKGGVSTLKHTASLNLAFERGDGRDIVLENLRLFGEAVGFEPTEVISLPQIHSSKVINVTKDMGGEGYFKAPHKSCDGYVTSEAGVVLGVKSADCVPIILEAEDRNGKIIAVSALHAGWRGTAAGIAAEGVKMLVSKGAKAEFIRAAIGPAIGACCFEVGEDFVLEADRASEGKWKAFERDGRLYADVKGYNLDVLLSCGLKPENIDMCADCTCCMEEKYYSHRRMKGERGTMLSIVCLI